MDKNLLKRYFRNQCTPEEIEQVLTWFQTKEGERFFEENIDRDMQQYADDDRLLLYPDVPTEKILQKIRRTKKRMGPKVENNRRIWHVRAVTAAMVCIVLAGVAYFSIRAETNFIEQEQEVTLRTISTQEDQHRLITLSDGTRIRLNSNSGIEISENYPEPERAVTLTGEAWFDVATDENRPFHIQADQAAIRVLGTEFNVKVDDASRNVQVAVSEGKVALNHQTDSDGRAAILTENTYAVFSIDSSEILIEKTPVDNYMSWISGQLFFYNEPLWVVSRYIERLYNISFRFENDDLKQLHLSTNMARDDLTSVLDIIAQTLGISYTLENKTITWKDNINP